MISPEMLTLTPLDWLLSNMHLTKRITNDVSSSRFNMSTIRPMGFSRVASLKRPSTSRSQISRARSRRPCYAPKIQSPLKLIN